MNYGHDRTIHWTTKLDIETTTDGKVVAVWFRCLALPFEQFRVSEDRAVEMERMYANSDFLQNAQITGIDYEEKK
jgi:hypothetical protein